jgi:hypothetical protein
MAITRRMALPICAIAAAGASAVLPSYGFPSFVPGDERYLPNPKLPAISYAGARSNMDAAVKLAIDNTQRDFDIKFTDAQIDVIHARIWNVTQLELNKHYRPKEID